MQLDTAHTAADHAAGFLPHGFCYLWNPALLWTHFVSDLLIGLAYVTISVSLAWLVHRARRDIPFSVAFVAFGLFIVTCGLTHFMGIWTLWQPVYWLEGGVKVVTALASVGTAIAMPFWVPRAHATIRDARLSRERELAAARAAALQEQNAVLEDQAAALEEQAAELEEQASELLRQRGEAEQLAADLRVANDELRRAVARAETAQGEAEAARRAADAANRAKSDFLAVMSHELRTPLNAIGGYTELLRMELRGPLTAAQQEDLRRIDRSQRHLLSLITDILNFSRLEAGQLAYEVRPVAVQPLLDTALELVAPQAAARGLRCAIAPTDQALAAAADPAKLQQIVLNLLSNAVKYTDAGGAITLSATARDGHVLVQVADTGIGIPADKHAAVFEPFVQLDQSLTRRTEGTGLGLAISRQLARDMGGELTVESAPGAGSTFTVTLPRAHAPHTAR